MTDGSLRISVIIPVLNEAETIGPTLRSLAPLGPSDVVLVDGGSTDRTEEAATAAAREAALPLRIVHSVERGRAVQLNAGAANSDADAYLFLHADTHLTSESVRALTEALSEPEVDAGTFRLRFDDAPRLLRFSAYWTRFPLGSIAFGDRGLFVRRTIFEAVGGYPDQAIFEDIELVRRLRAGRRFRFLRQPVITSARRYRAEGVWRQQWLNTRLWLRYRFGADPAELARRYRYQGTQGTSA